jgi:uncharacterized membrane protein/thiol-disulfide isomerase/thioredoxin
MKRATPLVILLRLALLVAIAASAALVIEYRNAGDPAFCGAGSGCFKVRVSEWSHVMGVPLPTIGITAYVALFGLALAARTRAHFALLAGLSSVGAVFAAVFIGLQHFAIHAYCPWCIGVDSSAIVAAVCSVALLRRGAGKNTEQGAPPREQVGPWIGAALAGIFFPFVWAQYPVHPPLHPELAALEVPGKVNVIEFTDFECPFCRSLHPIIDELRRQHEGAIHFERKMVPLENIHPGAAIAAYAYACAPDEAKDEVAGKLYAMPPYELTREGVDRVAASAWHAAWAACVDGGEGKARVDKDKAVFEHAGLRGLPHTVVGKTIVIGADPERLALAVEVEASGGRPGLPLAWMFVALGLVYGAVAAWSLRAARPSSAKKQAPPAA